MYRLMSAGPTQVSDAVMQARSQPFPNPDEDQDFVEAYHALCGELSELLGSREHETLILGGEGILGLEAACATLTEPGDRVLVLDNGLFGAGFADFIKMYGGEPVLYQSDYQNPLDPLALRRYLEQDSAFAYATLVHCDTPSGVRNDIAVLCPLLQEFGLLTLVDAVASMFGEPVDIKQGIDLLCGASQKVLSAPPGLSFVTISPRAWGKMKGRRSAPASFYANLLPFANYYVDKWFPYTMPVSDLQALAVAVQRIKADKGSIARHKRLAEACRAALQAGGLSLYPQSGHANTVTAFCVPEGLSAVKIQQAMREKHNIFLSSSFGPFGGKLLRIGHMGENCHVEPLQETLNALYHVLCDLGAPPRISLLTAFLQALE